jgi:hypothetical protein
MSQIRSAEEFNEQKKNLICYPELTLKSIRSLSFAEE